MNERWWSPEGDVDLLTPGGDRGRDLANVFLDLHRRGAKACEGVATHALADQAMLAKALIGMRAQAAPELVDAVGKSVETLSYAGLLVADLADDAEQAAMDVFTSIVAKGVPANQAALRTGLVYGIPKHSLGGYVSKAAELKTPLPVLTEQADRLLFGYSEVIAESENESVEVSKAGNDAWRTEQRGQPGNRGQFVEAVMAEPETESEGIGRQMSMSAIEALLNRVAPKEAEVEAPVKGPKKLAGPKRLAGPKVIAGPKLLSTGGKAGEKKLRERNLRAKKLSDKFFAAKERMSKEEIAEVLPDVLRNPDGTPSKFRNQHYDELENKSPVSFVLSTQQMLDLGGKIDTGFKLKLGDLENTASSPAMRTDTDQERQDFTEMITDVSRDHFNPGPGAFETHAERFVVNDAYLTASKREQQAMKDRRAAQVVDHVLRDQDLEWVAPNAASQDMADIAREEEYRRVKFITLADGSGDQAMVYDPNPEYVRTPEGEHLIGVTPLVHEFRISDHNLRGIEHPTRSGGIEVDPNQVLKLEGLTHGTEFFDMESNSRIEVWHVTTDPRDELGKAYDPQEARGQRGRWVAEKDAEVATPEPQRLTLDQIEALLGTKTGPKQLGGPKRLAGPKKLAPPKLLTVPKGDKKLSEKTLSGKKMSEKQAVRVKGTAAKTLVSAQNTAGPFTDDLHINGSDIVTVFDPTQFAALTRTAKRNPEDINTVLYQDATSGSDSGFRLGALVDSDVSERMREYGPDDDAAHFESFQQGEQVETDEKELTRADVRKMVARAHGMFESDPAVVKVTVMHLGPSGPFDDFPGHLWDMVPEYDTRAADNTGHVVHIVVHKQVGPADPRLNTVKDISPPMRWAEVPRHNFVAEHADEVDAEGGIPLEIYNPVVQIHHAYVERPSI